VVDFLLGRGFFRALFFLTVSGVLGGRLLYTLYGVIS